METQRILTYNAHSKQLILIQNNLRTLPVEVINTYAGCTEYLDLSHNRISNLEWIYDFENLKCLILDNNRLQETHLNRLKRPLLGLKVLTLNKNEFSDLETSISIISRLFPNLEYLSLHGSPICPDGLELQPFSQYVSYEYDQYRSFIISCLNKLKFLDHSAVQNKFMATVPQTQARKLILTPKMLWYKLKSSPSEDVYTPLPTDVEKSAGYHCGSIRKLSVSDSVYSGTNSEGNRFIVNSDL